MAHRYFTQNITQDEAYITGPDAVHLVRVLRAKPGDSVLLCNGAGMDFDAEVLTVGVDEVFLRVLAGRPTKAEPAIEVTVFAGMAKGERMDYAVQKSVELGAFCVVPFYSEYSVVKPGNDEKKVARYQKIAAEAAKQSGRGILPVVYAPLPFEEMLAEAACCEKALFFYEKGGASLRSAYSGQKSLAFITGPEGGFSAAEARKAEEAGCLRVGLGPRILRCETAPVAALAALMCMSGNLE